MLLPLQGALDSNAIQPQGDALGYVLLPLLGALPHIIAQIIFCILLHI